MKNFSTYLLVMFMILFWASRIMVAVTAQMNMEFAITPLNLEMEIGLLFVTLACMVLVVKRKLVGALIYLLAYGMYFGVDIYNNVQVLLAAVEGDVDLIGTYLNLFMSVIGMIIPIAVLFDMLADKGRKAHPKDKKTDWFYANEQFDRKLDDRADKNNYRTL